MKKTILVIVAVAMLLLSHNTASAKTLEQVKRQHYEQALKGPEGQQIKASVKKYSKQYNVDETLILAVIMTESSFNKNAKSPCGARGLMQLMPGTFKARNVGNNIWSIEQNIEAGTKHLAGLIARHKGNVYLALSSYNLGGAKVPIQGAVPKAAKHYVDKVFYHKAIIEGSI